MTTNATLSLKATSAQLGEVDAVLRSTGDAPLYVETAFAPTPGSFLPLRLIHPTAAEPLAVVCRVVRLVKNEAGEPQGLELALPEDDARVAAALRGWQWSVVDGKALAAAAGAAAELDLSAHVIEATPVPGSPAAHARAAKRADDRRAENQEAQRQFELLQAAAKQLEAEGKFAEAYAQLEQALDVFPLNADRQHVRLAQIALNHLGNLDEAARHATAAQALAPGRADLAALARDITARRSGASADAKRSAQRAEAVKHGARAGLALAAALSVLAVCGLFVWWYSFSPRGAAPVRADVSAIADLVPASHALVQREGLYVTVLPAWRELDEPRRLAALQQLVPRSRGLYSTERVVLLDASGVMVGFAQGEELRVFK